MFGEVCPVGDDGVGDGVGADVTPGMFATGVVVAGPDFAV
jgi:hypothetical protein